VSRFDRAAAAVSHTLGKPQAAAAALVVVLVWALSGPLFGFSDTWQLVINTGTTVVTFLMIFVVQHTQELNDRAMQVKLDELVRAVQGARDEVAAVEQRGEDAVRRAEQRPAGDTGDDAP
jgi:low affinity Fe/Cu permease